MRIYLNIDIHTCRKTEKLLEARNEGRVFKAEL